MSATAALARLGIFSRGGTKMTEWTQGRNNKGQTVRGIRVRTGSGSDRVFTAPSEGRLNAAPNTRPNAVGKASLPALLFNAEFRTRRAGCRARIAALFFSGTVGHGTKTETDGTNRTIFQIWWDSGTSGVNFIKHNNKVSHQTVPFWGPVGHYGRKPGP
jgi:hypothetical protein